MPALLLPSIRLLLLVTLALLCGGAGGPDGSVAGAQDEFRYKPAETLTTEATPVDRVAAIRYLYEDQGRLSDVITLANPEDPASVITHTRYTYDDRGNLIKEWQGLDGEIGSDPPAETACIDYTWDYAPTDNADHEVGHDRLIKMTYPRPPGGTEAERREVTLAYGDAGSTDDRISRITNLDSGYNTFSSPVASFAYLGRGTRAAMVLGSANSAITADLRAPSGAAVVGLPGLDTFGRLRDLHYVNTASETLFRAQHGYSVSGDRLYDIINQAPVQWLSGASPSGRSQVHSYDPLHRLTTSAVGEVSLTSGTAEISPGTQVRHDQWWLDLLGNWDSNPNDNSVESGNGRITEGNLDGYAPSGIAPLGATSASSSNQGWTDPLSAVNAASDLLHIAQDINGRNEVKQVDALTGASPTPQHMQVRYDAAGNLAFDGTFVYQYDAWGRLVQVNAGAVDTSILADPLNPYVGLVFGPMIKHYTFDGLGRLVRCQSPFPTVQDAANGEVRSERYYYDGIRRIQEVRLDPTMSLQMALVSGGLTQQMMAEQALENAEDANGITPGQGGQGGGVETAAAPLELENGLLNTWDEMPIGGPKLVREYVWGPGDAWHATPVDELLCYYDELRQPWFVLQDTGGDVAAVCGKGESSANYRARVVAQQRYDAYGVVIAADHIHPHPFLSVGHKGLFFDRLDRGVSDVNAQGAAVPPGTSAAVETPPLVPFARGLYHVRNRTYIPGGGSPSLIGAESITSSDNWATFTLNQNGLSSGAAVQGRWMQADPNGTGAQLVDSAGIHGRACISNIGEFNLGTHFADGVNVFEYLGSQSWAQSDPAGTSLFLDILATTAIRAEMVGEFGATTLLRGMRGGLSAMLEVYGANMESDVEWAMDWDESDDWHSRLNNSWVGESFALGAGMGMVEAHSDMFMSHDISDQFDSLGQEREMAGVSGTVGKGARVAARMLVRGAKAAFGVWLKQGTATVSVYLGKRNGKPYVGITNDVVRRGMEHGGQRLEKLAENLTRRQARAIENLIIKANPHFDNRIKSIADDHRFAKEAEAWAKNYMGKHGISLHPDR